MDAPSEDSQIWKFAYYRKRDTQNLSVVPYPSGVDPSEWQEDPKVYEEVDVRQHLLHPPGRQNKTSIVDFLKVLQPVITEVEAYYKAGEVAVNDDFPAGLVSEILDLAEIHSAAKLNDEMLGAVVGAPLDVQLMARREELEAAKIALEMINSVGVSASLEGVEDVGDRDEWVAEVTTWLHKLEQGPSEARLNETSSLFAASLLPPTAFVSVTRKSGEVVQVDPRVYLQSVRGLPYRLVQPDFIRDWPLRREEGPPSYLSEVDDCQMTMSIQQSPLTPFVMAYQTYQEELSRISRGVLSAPSRSGSQTSPFNPRAKCALFDEYIIVTAQALESMATDRDADIADYWVDFEKDHEAGLAPHQKEVVSAIKARSFAQQARVAENLYTIAYTLYGELDDVQSVKDVASARKAAAKASKRSLGSAQKSISAWHKAKAAYKALNVSEDAIPRSTFALLHGNPSTIAGGTPALTPPESAAGERRSSISTWQVGKKNKKQKHPWNRYRGGRRLSGPGSSGTATSSDVPQRGLAPDEPHPTIPSVPETAEKKEDTELAKARLEAQTAKETKEDEFLNKMQAAKERKAVQNRKKSRRERFRAESEPKTAELSKDEEENADQSLKTLPDSLNEGENVMRETTQSSAQNAGLASRSRRPARSTLNERFSSLRFGSLKADTLFEISSEDEPDSEDEYPWTPAETTTERPRSQPAVQGPTVGNAIQPEVLALLENMPSPRMLSGPRRTRSANRADIWTMDPVRQSLIRSRRHTPRRRAFSEGEDSEYSESGEESEEYEVSER